MSHGKYSVDTSFLGQRTPKEIKLLIKELKKAKQDVYSKSIGAVLRYIREGVAPDFSTELDSTATKALFAGFYCLISAAARHNNMHVAAFSRDLKDINLPQEVIEALCSAMFTPENTLKPLTAPKSRDTTHVTEVDWRVDVILSNNSLAKVLQPEVLLELSLSDGSAITSQLSAEEFHNLRHTTAKLLHDMCQLKERKFMNKK